MNEIKCPYDLNKFLLGEPIFENTFPKEECEQRKFYGDCYHCFSTAIARRDRQLKNTINKIRTEIENHCGLTKENHCRYCSYCNSVMGVREILEIIDKYKVEGENK